MPWATTVDQVVEFFADYEITKSDVILEEKEGKKTGFGLAFFPDQDTAKEAKEALNKQHIGTRYVDLLFISS